MDCFPLRWVGGIFLIQPIIKLSHHMHFKNAYEESHALLKMHVRITCF